MEQRTHDAPTNGAAPTPDLHHSSLPYAFAKRDYPIPPDPYSSNGPPDRDRSPPIAAPGQINTAAANANSSPAQPQVRYRECLRNHAASVGGVVVDGCGEFLPADDAPLKCVVCSCHRSFHRKEVEGEIVPAPAPANNSLSALPRHAVPPYYYHPYHLNNSGGRSRLLSAAPPPPPLLALPPPHSRQQLQSQPLKPSPIMAFRGGGNESSGGGMGETDSSSEEMDAHTPVTPAPPPWPQATSRKRFRTKFTVEQKERMLEFAGALGWRMQRRDEGAVERFCAEVGVPRKVFKVWMHNNKHASTRSQLPIQPSLPQVVLQDHHTDPHPRPLSPP